MSSSQFLTSDFNVERFVQDCMAVPEFAFIEQHLSKKGVDWYVVGGCVRDYVLTRQLPSDIDIVIHSKWVNTVANLLHQQFKMHIVALDENFGIYRAIDSDKRHYFDIATLQGHAIEMDLARRDLTINAIAINVHTRKLIDPYNGLLAILEKRINSISEMNFLDDPLRLLRLYRFYAQLPDFKIDPKAEELIHELLAQRKVSLRRVAIERIHDELGKLLLGPNAVDALNRCVETKMLLEPLPGFSQMVWQKLTVLFTLTQKLEGSLSSAIQKDPVLVLWLGLVAINHVKLADFTLLSERYRWSQFQRNIILRVMTFLSQNDSPEITDDFFDSLGQDALCYWIYAYVSLSLDELSRQYLLDSDNVDWTEQFNTIWHQGLCFWEREKTIPKLLSGTDLVKYFKRESGPWVGAALAMLRSAQRQNKVHDYKEALEYLKQALANQPEKA